MSSREETIKYLEGSIRDFKQFCGNQDRKKVMNDAYTAIASLYATLDLLKEQKENEHNGEKESEQGS